MIKHSKHRVYYSMGEVAEMFDLTPSLIRYWESQFDILKPDKNRKGNRMFTPKDVDNLKIIYHLVKEKGMTLKGAQRRIESSLDDIARNVEIVDKLLNVKSVLLEIREELNRVDVGEGGVELLIESLPKRLDETQQGGAMDDNRALERDDDGAYFDTWQADDSQAIETDDQIAVVEATMGRNGEKPFEVTQEQEKWSAVDGLELGVEEQAQETKRDSIEELEAEMEQLQQTHSLQEPLETEPESVVKHRVVADETIAHLVHSLIDTEIDVVPEYIALLSQELSEEAQTAIEVMEALVEMDEEKQERPEVREQTLF